ncbi:hypothetical protein [Accumulibacter sp.]|uniref:hypothetical protein n=1 Tax=Accumulibacter sp. TaxID=2053492 RepID=UPI001A4260B1|nr:hypothetical protein [Accumulibacter sp.]MBL8402252.1 hypothetical protein [Accumulibacter sp.]
MKTLLAIVIASSAFVSGQTLADQPNMEAALASLQQAKESLQRATLDKGGHRVKAIKAVDAAIAEVKAGIEFDRTRQSRNENQKK